MAIISTGSAEAIAVSSLISYDIYKPYFNPKANGDDVIRVSRIVIPIYCVLAGALATVLWAIGIRLGCAVSPLWFCLTNSRVSAKAAIAAAWAGCISGYVAWICTCAGLGDPLDRFGLGTLSSMLAADVFSKTYFAFWIFVVIAWGFFASVIIIGLPIYESFGEIAVITRALTGLGGGASKDEIALSERGGKSVEA